MAEAMVACFDIDLYTRHENRIFANPPDKGRIFLTKDPKDIIVVGPILKINPDLHVICMVRDPRDTIVSKHRKDPDKYWASLRYWKTYMPIWRRLRIHPRFITVIYEEFVSEPDRVQQKLLDEMPFLIKKSPFSRYHEVAKPSGDSLDALRGVRPIEPVSLGNWLNHLPRVAGQIQRHGSISKDLIDLAYEKDDSWLDILEGIEPDLSLSHWPEYATKSWIRDQQRGKYREVVKVLMRRIGLNPSKTRRKLLLGKMRG